LGDSGSAVASVFRNASLRWLELSWTAWILGHWAYLIAVSVYAYGAGGEKAVGIIFLLRLVPAAIVSPFAGLLADRFRREQVLLVTNLGRISLIGAAAAGVILDAPPTLVYALAIADAIVATPVRSAQAALMPALARDPAELTAANAVARGVESFAVFGGPALAGLLLAVTSTGAVFVVTALMLAVSVLFISLVRVPQRERPRSEVEASTIVSEALAGFRAIGHDPSLRVMMGLFTAETAVAGALQVYIVVLALESLDLGDGGVGFLNSAMGVGALVGAVAALSLAGVRRLSPAFLVGLVLRGVPLVAVGLVSDSLVPVLVFLAVFGLGGAFVDVPGLTIVQRSVQEDVLARVFGVIQMLWLSSIGIGAALAPVLVGWLGLDGALIATGALLPALVVLFGVRLVRIDAEAVPPRADELRILASIPIFTPLPGLSLEHLAGRLVPLRLEPETVIVRQGDPGDRFFIVAEGAVEVSEYGRPISELGAGGYFGEISLIRDVPRTATVTAKTPVVLYALDREDFLAAVTSHAPSAEAAEEVVSSRLAGVPVAGAKLPAG
jgi:Na+/melibiose symporter-like transporter